MQGTLLWELFVELLQRLPTALLILLTGTIAIIAFARNGRFRFSSPLLSPVVATFHNCRRAIIAILTILMLGTWAGAAYGRHAGWLPYLTFEGLLDAKDLHDLSGTRVLAFRGDSKTTDICADVDQSGYFSFNELYRDRYRFLAFKIVDGEPLILISEFGRDLRATDFHLRDYPFPRSSKSLIKLATLYFDTDRHDLDRVARREIQRLLRTTPGMETVFWFGHTDERGSARWNLTLGSWRALEAHNSANTHDAPFANARNIVASFGKSWPAVQGDGAAAWAANRRVDIYGVSP